MHEIISCTKCQQKLRIPKYHPLIKIKCPACKTSWEISSTLHQGQYDEESLSEDFEKAYEEKQPNFKENINVAVVGKVSTGKSSLINAIFGRDRSDPLAPVGATSGVTTKVTAYRLDESVLFIDCPGLDDVREENSDETKRFLSAIDVGLFVVTGSADDTQRSNFNDLRGACKKVFVVLNKVDEWDDLEDSEYQKVLRQWKESLGTDKIYGVCTKGYDPKTRKGAPMDLRGIDELRGDIFSFLDEEGKSILLARHLKNKDSYAVKVISAALIAVAAEAFVPGSAAYITATQVAAIASLNYLYTGSVLSKSSALALLPTFAGQSIGSTVFLWAKSLLPPTGVVDVAAATVAVIVTFAMLAAVKWTLANGYGLDQKEILIDAFNEFKSAGSAIKTAAFSDFKSSEKIMALVSRLIEKRA